MSKARSVDICKSKKSYSVYTNLCSTNKVLLLRKGCHVRCAWQYASAVNRQVSGRVIKVKRRNLNSRLVLKSREGYIYSFFFYSPKFLKLSF